MKNENERTLPDLDQAADKRRWQTPDLEEMDVQETAAAPPVTGGGDGPFNYS